MNFAYFPLREFTQTLAITHKVKERLGPFIQEIENSNIQWMFQIMIELYQYTTSYCDVNYKFNSLVALKMIIDTCQFPVILIVQTYFLQQIRKIATHKIHLAQKERGSDYFINLGYEKSEINKKLGYNYVRLACEIITVLACVKPAKLFRAEQTSVQSDFAKILDIMKAQQWKEYDVLAFYKENELFVRGVYVKKLKTFQHNSHKYFDFFQNFLDKLVRKEYVSKSLDLKKILQSCQMFACQYVFVELKEMMEEKQANIVTNVVKVFTDFIRWGNIKAFYIIQVQSIFENYLNLIKKCSIDIKTPERSTFAFESIYGTDEQKRQLYIELLRSLQIWAMCIPKNPIHLDLESKCSLFYKLFVNDLGLQIVNPANISKIKIECEQNLAKNMQINLLIMGQLNKQNFDYKKMKITSGEIRDIVQSNMINLRIKPKNQSNINARRHNRRLNKFSNNKSSHDPPYEDKKSIIKHKNGKSFKSKSRSKNVKFNFSQNSKNQTGSEYCSQSQYYYSSMSIDINDSNKKQSYSQLRRQSQAEHEKKMNCINNNSRFKERYRQSKHKDSGQLDEAISDQLDEDMTSEIKSIRIFSGDVRLPSLKDSSKKPIIKMQSPHQQIKNFPQNIKISNIQFFEDNHLHDSITGQNLLSQVSLEEKLKSMVVFNHMKLELISEKQNQTQVSKKPTLEGYHFLEAKVQTLQMQNSKLHNKLKSKENQLQQLIKMKNPSPLFNFAQNPPKIMNFNRKMQSHTHQKGYEGRENS